MPSIPRSELTSLLRKYNQCRFPSLSDHAIHLRGLHRDNPEFRTTMVEHNRRMSKTRKYSPEAYRKMQEHGRRIGSCPKSQEKKKKTMQNRHILRKNNKKRTYEKELRERPNDYAGVITMSDYASL